MIYATLINKANNQAFGQVSVASEAELDAYRTADVDAVLGWDQPIIQQNAEELATNFVRNQRNQLLDDVAWTIRADSPLSTDNQAAWLTYMQQLQNLTVNYPDPETVVWPTQPDFEYA